MESASADLAPEAAAALHLAGLRLRLPDGQLLLEDLELVVQRGEVVVILGGSGAGKSTLVRALFEPDELRQQGFELSWERLQASGLLGLVPQQGAPFDYLDVAGNLELALRHRQPGLPPAASVTQWLAAVDLPTELSRPGTPVSHLSGGQAQRLAVARTLANGRDVLFLDEPSAGLDPARIVGLAGLLRQQAAAGSASLIVVTHDTQLASLVGDRLLFLDPARRRLVPVLANSWPGPALTCSPGQQADQRGQLERQVLALLGGADANGGAASAPAFRRRRWRKDLQALAACFAIPVLSLAQLPALLRRHPRDLLAVFGRVFASAVSRPLPFYLVVAVLLGYTLLYVIGRALPAGLQAATAVELIGGSYILALTPPISAFLFVATSGSAVSAWLGTLSLTRQTAALEALGLTRQRYLWVPAWLCLFLAFLLTAVIFGGGLLLGGAWQSYQAGVADPWPLLWGDLVDPLPERQPLRTRAGWLIVIYAAGMAADVVQRGTTRKEQADDVTRGMTGSVVTCTLWVVTLELLSALFVFNR